MAEKGLDKGKNMNCNRAYCGNTVVKKYTVQQIKSVWPLTAKTALKTV
jgi:hypothetical protein